MSLSRRAFGWSLAGLLAAGAAPAMAFGPDNWPNLFIAPMGQPFRAKADAPYPVVDWFKAADKNADGKIDHAEFMADAGAFFETLDLNHDGVLNSNEVVVYERVVAPEVLGIRVIGDLRGGSSVARHDGGRLWRAQFTPGQPGSDVPVYDGPEHTAAVGATEEVPEGAALFSFLNVPEPLAAADVNFSGVITKANFLKVADRRFDSLDAAQDGYLTLAKLPKTFVQRKLEHTAHKGFLR